MGKAGQLFMGNGRQLSMGKEGQLFAGKEWQLSLGRRVSCLLATEGGETRGNLVEEIKCLYKVAYWYVLFLKI
jgi:hypothetical protein